ncbi:MAG: hypothetical protein M3O30_06485 [Planctomycetota bacterium]|nr:hypothetical protein [Planctomycetota bacterium]
MALIFISHEVKNGDQWAQAWQRKTNSRHEIFAKIGIKARTFRDAKSPNFSGVLLDVPDMAKLNALLASPEGKKAMEEDGLKPETIRVLTEFGT